MGQIRTDLAVEAKEIWDESAEKNDKMPGVDAKTEVINGFSVTTVQILDNDGEKALNKPIGTYITMAADPYIKREEDAFNKACITLENLLKSILKLDKKAPVLVVGLGNENITPDIIGPAAIKNTMVTRHLVNYIPEHFADMRQVAAIAPGVLAETGIESSELIKAAVERSNASAVIVIDALAARKLSRICRTVQISDTGIIPGSGVGNARNAINKEIMGVPVISIGVPTVVDAGTLAYDIISSAGSNVFEPDDFSSYGGGMIVTPGDIDKSSADMAKLLGYSVNLALHDGLTVDDITMFLE